MTIPNTIKLISRGRHEEFVCDADTYPGMITARKSNGNIIPHNVAGGNCNPLMVAKEVALRGLNKTQPTPSGEPCPVQVCAKGDLMLFLLAIGQNVARADKLMSDGAGGLTAYPVAASANKLYQINAASTNITNTNTETTFSNGSYTIPASSLVVGDVLNIHARATCAGQNSTNTHRVRLYIGATAIGDSTAIQLASGDFVLIDAKLTVRTIGASGTFVVSGTVNVTVSATATVTPYIVASTAIDTTATQAVAVKSLASAASTGNIVRLDEYEIELDRAGLSVETPLVEAYEAINNSAGSAYAFIRGLVL